MVVVPNVDSTATTSAKSFLLDEDDQRPNYRVPSHFGSASKAINAFSVHMLSLMNGCERSLVRAQQVLTYASLKIKQREWESLINGCGLRITSVYPLRAHTAIVECTLDT
jgi:hypothetical protein